MNWKRKIAKEWIWFICAVTGAFIAWNIFFYLAPDIKIREAWEEMFEYPILKLIIILPIVLLYSIRLTIWAIKELRRAEKTESEEEGKKLIDSLEKGKDEKAGLEILAEEAKGKEKKPGESKKSRGERTITFGGIFGNKY